MRMSRNFRMAMEDWDEVCSALGPWEAKHLTGNQAKAALEQHRAWVSQLLAWGQVLQRVTEHSAFSEPATANRVNARIRHLQDKLSLWHAAMSPEEETRILQAAFA
jgi:hypothetical protein